MDELARLRLLLPVIISKFHSLSSPVWMSACVHVRGQKVDADRHVFPVALRCACVCVRARLRSLVCLQVQPIFPWPRLEQQTNMQRPAPRCTEIFLDCCVTERQAVGGTSFSKPNDIFFSCRLDGNFLFMAYKYKTTRLWPHTCREADSRSKYSLEAKEETWSRC